MKISASVPDDLWNEAAAGEQSASQVVQDALRALLAHRRAGEERVADFEERISRHDYDGTQKDLWAERVLDRLAASAVELHDTGYRMALEIAGELDWMVLEDLPSGNRLLAMLIEGATQGTALDHGVGERVVQALSDWEQGINEIGEVVPSPTLFQGLADGFDDVRGAVRERLRRATDPGGGS